MPLLAFDRKDTGVAIRSAAGPIAAVFASLA
jgi:hypothetical protein